MDGEERTTPPVPLDELGMAGDVITVDKKSCCVGDTVMVTWEINTRPLHERDFIGMFEIAVQDEIGGRGHTIVGLGHVTTERLLDSRVRGDTSACGGYLHWELAEDIFPKRKL